MLDRFTCLLSRPKKSLESLISNVKDDSLDLLRRLLQFNPDKRITADDALEHNYVARFVHRNAKFLVQYHRSIFSVFTIQKRK